MYGLYGFRCSLVLTYVAPLSAFILYEQYPRYSLTVVGCQVLPGGVMYITLVPVGRMYHLLSPGACLSYEEYQCDSGMVLNLW